MPDDTRYTNILKKYNKQLSVHWKTTRDSYISKITKKQLLELDDAPEDYEDPQYDSSNYIDEALIILAEAFGMGILIGYEELDKRGLSVILPENPHKLFDEAIEIKNYAWAALSYEQSQMNDIFKEYNKLDNAKQKIANWFDNNEYRLTDLMLGGVVWYAISFGFTKAAIETYGDEAKGLLYWITEQDKNVCDDCNELEAGNPYSNDNPLPTLPGGGKTICGSRCRCIVDIKE